MERALIILSIILSSFASEAANKIEGNVVDADSILLMSLSTGRIIWTRMALY